MIFRLILLFLLVAFLIWIIRRQFGQNETADSNSEQRLSEDILRCEYCGTHVPRSSGLIQNGQFYCCKQHADNASQSNGSENLDDSE